jgi:hypothetical protein
VLSATVSSSNFRPPLSQFFAKYYWSEKTNNNNMGGGLYGRTGDRRDSYGVWVEKMPLVRPRRRRKDNIKMFWLRAGTVCRLYEHGNEPSVSIKCWEFLE